MWWRLADRLWHYGLLLLVAGLVCLPGLGTPGLWDIDEGNNAEAAREMLQAGDCVVPTFNYHLRPDKPALLYWLQMGAYRVLGVGELAARLPSAVAALAAVLLTYELGRSLFGPVTGLLSGLVLAGAAMVCAAGRFANPDSLLNACTVLLFFAFWKSTASARVGWFWLMGAAAGLGVLAKGPVGVVLPAAVAAAFLLWAGRARWGLQRGVVWALAAFFVVAMPWYVLVGVETHGDFLREFLLRHNHGRFVRPMEGHAGPWYYYFPVVIVGLAPWSMFLGPAAWHGTGRRGRADAGFSDAYRLLWSWAGVYLFFFSLSATKLPNYVLPAYPALAVLTGRFLERWRRGEAGSGWAMGVSLLGLALVGVAASLAILVAGGALAAPQLHGRALALPAVRASVWIGAIPAVGAGLAAWLVLGGRRVGAIATLVSCAACFLGALGTWGAAAVDTYKAPRYLAASFHAEGAAGEIRLGSFEYDQPSLVFYCRREVQRLANAEAVRDFLRYPIPVYLFVPVASWETLRKDAPGSCRLLGRHHDLYRNCDILLVTNR